MSRLKSFYWPCGFSCVQLWLHVCAGIVLSGHSARSSGQELTVPEPLSPEIAASTMIVPEGFQVTLFAGEPDVQQPIGFCIDDRGRLWVAEAYSYPQHSTTGKDRIVILEDQNGDGRHDRRTVFYEGLNYVTGIEVGFGGAWVMSPPNLYFIPDRNGDDVPDGPPEVLLDGFGNHANSHNLANGFAWGPDGWLYGTHGRTNWSKIGRPGTPVSERIVFDGGVYRYHPVRHLWEPYADGTTNPWGIDWNDFGEAFICNCVNPHVFHVIQGAHYEPWRNRKSSEFAFERIPTIADHLHFTGGYDTRRGIGTAEEDAVGGGHAHCGTMIYLGDNWPERYRNSLFMNNIHGRRINNDILNRKGSGYTASHGPDLMRSADPWFMGVTLAYGPDGSVFVSDWSDTGECHSVRNTQKHTGRIFRIRYAQPVSEPPAPRSLAKASNTELVALHLERNDWWVRHARRNLQERHAAGNSLSDAIHALQQMFAQHPDVTRRLRALWTLHALGAADEISLLQLLQQENEYLRIWGIRLLCDTSNPPKNAVQMFERMAQDESAAGVRLQLASALQRIPIDSRLKIARELAARADDADDDNIPLMLWYGIEPIVQTDPAGLLQLAADARIPLLRRHIARRLVLPDQVSSGMPLLVALLRKDNETVCKDLLQGMLVGLEGHRSLPLPNGWAETYARLQQQVDPDVRSLSMRLALIFNDPVAVQNLSRVSVDARMDATERIQAIQALVARRTVGFEATLLRLLSDPITQEVALQGLAGYEHPDTASSILRAYPTMSMTSRQSAIQTLASRREWANELLNAVDSGIIARSEITAYAARQIANLSDRMLTDRLSTLWGEVRVTAADRTRQIVSYKRRLTPEAMAQADLTQGRTLFRKHCGNCHRFFGEGGRIGPDITGAQRTNLDYLLENLIDPSAAVARDYQMEIVQTRSGRVITGLIESENDQALTVLTVNERIVIPQSEIEERQTSSVSMMPEGLLQPLSTDEVRDLLAYLASAQQIPLPSE